MIVFIFTSVWGVCNVNDTLTYACGVPCVEVGNGPTGTKYQDKCYKLSVCQITYKSVQLFLRERETNIRLSDDDWPVGLVIRDPDC